MEGISTIFNRTRKMKDADFMVTKFCLLFGTPTGLAGLSLTDWDLRLAVFLKLISILSFLLVIVLNIGKCYNLIKTIIFKLINKKQT